MDTFLPPVEKPNGLMMKLVYYFTRRQYGKVEQYRTSSLFSDKERALLDYVAELVKDKNVHPTTFDRLKSYYNERAICEIIWLVASEHVYNITILG